MKSVKSWAFRAPSALLLCGVAVIFAACMSEAPTDGASAEKAGEAVSASRSFHSGSRRSGAIVNIDKLCLEALPGDLCDGAPLHLSRCDSCRSPWSFTDRGEIIGPEGMCLDAAWGHTADGTAVRLWECNGTDSQQWRLTHDDSIVGPGGKCLSTRCVGSQDESALELQCCDGAPDQRWYFDPD